MISTSKGFISTSKGFEILNGAVVVLSRLPEYIGPEDVAEIADTVFDMIQPGERDFIFDLGGVENVSVAAVAFMVVTREKLAEGELRLVNVSQGVMDIFRFCKVYDDLREHFFRPDDGEFYPTSAAVSFAACSESEADDAPLDCGGYVTTVAAA